MSNSSLNIKRAERVLPSASDKANKLESLSYHVSSGIGKFFYNLGIKVAENPKKTILLSWLSVLVCCIGFLRFHQERDPLKLWVPTNSDFLKNTEFIVKNFGEGVRTQNVLIVADDVLTSKVLGKLALISKEINEIRVAGESEEVTFDKICFKIPLIAAFTAAPDDDRRRKRSDFSEDFFNDGESSESKKALRKILEPFMNFDMKKYCKMIDMLQKGCLRENFLELWKSNGTKISELTKEQIISKLNRTEYSPETGHEANFVNLLGGVETNSSGYITSAKSLLASWMVHINFSQVDSSKLGNMAGTESWATYDSLVFEARFLEIMRRLKDELETDGVKIYYGAGRSYGDISSKTLFQDMDKLILGVALMMLYMVFVLSKFSWTEMRISLTSIGLLNVGMAYVAGNGISSVFFSYSPVHTSLFFIIMGLGVDDIFVIMSTFRKVRSESKGLTSTEIIGKTMEKAGASITITSLTDIIAFLVGGTTVLPSLKSFCIFAAMCILMTYLYVVTFFVAALTLDERRVASNRNCCFPCVVHKKPEALWWDPKFLQRFITFLYKKFVLTRFGKFCIIIVAITLTIFSTVKVFQIKQKFDPIWFIPSSSYYFQYVMAHRDFYPNRGFEAGVYMGSMNYSAELPRINGMVEEIKRQTNILSNVQAWTDPFAEFIEQEVSGGSFNSTTHLTDSQFKYYMSKFLFSSYGGPFQANFKFNKNIICGQPTSDVRISSVTFNFHKFEDRDEYLPAKKTLEKIIRNANFANEDVFLWGKIFANWITDEIIDEEIFRNISLALIGVFVCTAVMIVNLQVCVFIFLCVLLSLLSVGGFMQLWGLSLDLVTCISLQLSVGLCIDCAAHIGHTFLTISDGDGDSRALKTVEVIGAAVWQGGFSTMLAVSLLAFSEAYTFQTFFKVFTIVIIFGLFYGTFLLPVILSIFKPKPYDIRRKSIQRNTDGTELQIIDAEQAEFIEKSDKNQSDCDKDEIDKFNVSK